MDKNLKKFIIILSTMQIINNNIYFDYEFELNNTYTTDKNESALLIYSNKSTLFKKMTNLFSFGLVYPVLTSGHHILIYIKTLFENNDTINLTKKEIILENKIFYYEELYSKKNNKLIIINPGIGSLSFNSNNSSFYYIDNLFKKGYNIIILYRDYFNIHKSILYYDPFDISNYLNLFIKNIIKSDYYKSNQFYLFGMSGGCYTVLKYLSDKSIPKPEQLKSGILISSSPNIGNNIKQISTLISIRINYSLVNSINSYNNNYNLKTTDNLYTTLGKLGIKNTNFKTYAKYYSNLDDLNKKVNQIKIPIILLNAEDDNIAHIKFINEYINNESNNINVNFNFIITKYGWHGMFYNKDKNFIEKLIEYFFD